MFFEQNMNNCVTLGYDSIAIFSQSFFLIFLAFKKYEKQRATSIVSAMFWFKKNSISSP